jgi:imidazolonepropionase-like amidohydrolase
LADEAYPSTYQAPVAAQLLFINATILGGAGSRVDHGELLIDGGKVIAVGRNLGRPVGVTVLDARGRWITPGLIDVHTHLGTFTLPQTSQDADASDVTETSDPNAADT